jgi:hypothetical protein
MAMFSGHMSAHSNTCPTLSQHNTPAQFTPGLVHTACRAASTNMCFPLLPHTHYDAGGSQSPQTTVTCCPRHNDTQTTSAAWQSCTACSSTNLTRTQCSPSAAFNTAQPTTHHKLGQHITTALRCALLWYPPLPAVLRPCVQLHLLHSHRTAVMAAVCLPPLLP